MTNEDSSSERLDACQELIGYRFADPGLLRLALTHSSDKNSSENSALLDNERLEFLGDAVLGMIVCEKLFADYPDFSEGELTAVKSVVVSRAVLASVSTELGLPDFMSLGKGLARNKRLPKSLRANIFEAVLGAIYLDGGLDAARAFVLEHLNEQIKLVEHDQHQKNFKSLLQDYAQKRMGHTPTYRVIAEEGPDHIKEFEVVALIGRTEYARGKGKSKKDAEQHAAQNTFLLLVEKRGDRNRSADAGSDP